MKHALKWRVKRTMCALMLISSFAMNSVGQNEAYFSFQGIASPAAFDPVFSLDFNLAVGGGPVSLTTLHQAGGINAAGQAIAGGGFDPLLKLYDWHYYVPYAIHVEDEIASDDDGGPGNDSALQLPGLDPANNYTLKLYAAKGASPSGAFAVDAVLPNGSKVASTLSSIHSLTFGARGTGTAVVESRYLDGVSVTFDQGAVLAPTFYMAAGSISGIGEVRLTDATTLDVGGNGDSTTFAGTVTGYGSLTSEAPARSG
jgi:hypothetical protein